MQISNSHAAMCIFFVRKSDQRNINRKMKRGIRKVTFVRSAWRKLICGAIRRRERGFYVTIYKKLTHRVRAIECGTHDIRQWQRFVNVSCVCETTQNIFSSHLFSFLRFPKLYFHRRYWRQQGLLLRLDNFIKLKRFQLPYENRYLLYSYNKFY